MLSAAAKSPRFCALSASANICWGESVTGLVASGLAASARGWLAAAAASPRNKGKNTDSKATKPNHRINYGALVGFHCGNKPKSQMALADTGNVASLHIMEEPDSSSPANVCFPPFA